MARSRLGDGKGMEGTRSIKTLGETLASSEGCHSGHRSVDGNDHGALVLVDSLNTLHPWQNHSSLGTEGPSSTTCARYLVLESRILRLAQGQGSTSTYMRLSKAVWELVRAHEA